MSIPQADVVLTFVTRRQQLKNKLHMVLVMQLILQEIPSTLLKIALLVRPKNSTFFCSHWQQGLYEQVWEDL